MPPLPPSQLQDYFNTLLTTADLVKLFRRSEMTISIWREKHRLPFYTFPSTGGRPAVRYDLDLIKEWAVGNNKEVHIRAKRKRKSD